LDALELVLGVGALGIEEVVADVDERVSQHLRDAVLVAVRFDEVLDGSDEALEAGLVEPLVHSKLDGDGVVTEQELGDGTDRVLDGSFAPCTNTAPGSDAGESRQRQGRILLVARQAPVLGGCSPLSGPSWSGSAARRHADFRYPPSVTSIGPPPRRRRTPRSSFRSRSGSSSP